MFGWCGKILKIDLSSKKYDILNPDINILKKYIGGKGLAGYYLKDHITLNWHDPDMPLIFFTGPLVNTISPTSGRMTIMSKSPLTGTIGDSSVGGSFGFSLKRAGFDGIIITGKNFDPCGIEINDDSIKFTDASSLKKLKINEINNLIKHKGSTAVAGPAAENGVLFSNIVIDNHYFAGRNGLGLLFSSKGLKYITVKGTGKTKTYDKESLKKARQDIFRLTFASPVLMGELGISNFGTAALYDLIDNRRMMPTDNFRKTHFNNACSMNAHTYKKKFNPKKQGCLGCHILCKYITENGSSIPEFETMSHFSALINNNNISVVMEANKICNEMGMDTISAGATIACYIEILNKKLSGSDIISILKKIGYAKGIGNELSKGAFRFAESKGKSEAAITVKKLELPAYDPRGALGMALAYATSTRGGCHLRSYPISHEILRKPVSTDRFAFSGKARIIKIQEDLNAIIDSLTACKFIFFAATLEEFSKVYTSITGIETTAQDLLKIGERIYYNERIMNSLNGFTKKDDDLPSRFFKYPGTSGNNIDIPPINRAEFIKTLENYYKIRGLNINGIPTKEKSKELELEWKI